MTTFGTGNTSLYLDHYHFIQDEDGAQELYDMKEDPNEWYNLATKEAYADVITSLQKHLPKQYEPYIMKHGFSRAANPYFNERASTKPMPKFSKKKSTH